MTQVFTFEELITNDLFIAYSIRREASALQYWEAYLEQFPDQAPILEKARRTVILLHDALAPLAADDAAEDFRRILEAPQAGAAVHRIRPWYGKAAVAAAVALAVAAAAWWLLPGKHPIAPQIIASAPGERKTVTLADGSSVILNANSQLILSPSFNKKNRDLTLRGEAFFDVHQDAGHPFIIHTRQMDVKVLGTSFNVMAYENDRKTETSLISGALEVTVKMAPKKRFC
jgi:ferric-dicitrate binding protein FerR (iron transport regulator)